MLNIIIVISTIIAVWGAGVYIGFARGEGVDERGKSILAKASHITMSFVFLTFSVLILVVGFLNLSAEILEVIIVIALSLLIFINAISIMYLRKNE